ncbi:MAG: 2-dehydropantoate 2-reductase [Alphaproteobacteria bacterium]|nr:2-dehydropantoate 2-reductase [Alphaproteobacteria bacterium]
MKICIYGAGAIGGYLGAGLALNGADVTLIARGPHLAAMQEHGLKLIKDGEERVAKVTATDDPAEAGPQDYVIVTLKAHSVPPIADQFAPLFHDETAVVWGVNGIPWWYFHGLEGDHKDRRIECLDPGGVLWDHLGPERMIGCAVYPAAEVPEPGVIQHVEGDRFSLGEPSGEKTERIQALSAALISAGFKAPVRPQIRNELWVKLWGNLSFNPISALTHATLETIGTDPGTREIARRMMLEGQEIGEALGVRFAVDVEKRINGAVAVGAHKTSMLQDLERGRPMEIDALVTSVQEMGRVVGVQTPYIDAILALVQQRGREAGCYAG